MSEKNMTWNDFMLKLVVDYCAKRTLRTFRYQDFMSDNRREIEEFRPSNRNAAAKARQQLQFLRDDGHLTFVDNRGTYTLRGHDILRGELPDESALIEHIKSAPPDKREYLVETYVRDVGWAKLAKEKYGHACMMDSCGNTFRKNDGSYYIEVHHIVPLYKNGEDAIWNLSVLCAHHHKMAHYADNRTRLRMQSELLKIAETASE